ncbi:MAG: Gfo/Idh/MocA family protein [Bacillota bacterium]
MKKIKVGMLGYGLMGKTHAHAYRILPNIYTDQSSDFSAELLCLCGRSSEKVAFRSAQYGFQSFETDWRKMLERYDLDIFDNCGPDNVHPEPSIRAAETGKHVICEKPLALKVEDAFKMLEAVDKAKVKHMCAFNLRFIPAVQLAKKLIERGAIGRLLHIRAAYLEDPITNVDLLSRHKAGSSVSGVIGDLGCHAIDLLRFLIDEPVMVSALSKDVVQSGEVSLEDIFVATVEFNNGVIGTLESSKFAIGRRSSLEVQIYGQKGTIMFDLANLNYLKVYLPETATQNADLEGINIISVTGSKYPAAKEWWGAGENLGWGEIFVNEIFHFVSCIANDTRISPLGATFEDGYKAAVVCDALTRSAQLKKAVTITY